MVLMVGGVKADVTDTNKNGTCTIQTEEDINTALSFEFTKKNDNTPCTVLEITKDMTITGSHDFKGVAIRVKDATLTINGGRLNFTERLTSNKFNAAISLIGNGTLDVKSGSVNISDSQGYGIIGATAEGSITTTGVTGTIKVTGANSSIIIDKVGSAGIKNTNEITVSDQAKIEVTNSTNGISVSTPINVDNATIITSNNKTGINGKLTTKNGAVITANKNTNSGITLEQGSEIKDATIEALENGVDLAVKDAESTISGDAVVKVGIISKSTYGTAGSLAIKDNADLTYATLTEITSNPTSGVVRQYNEELKNYKVDVYGTVDGTVTVNNGDIVKNHVSSPITVKVTNSSETFTLKKDESKIVNVVEDLKSEEQAEEPKAPESQEATGNTADAKNPGTSDNFMSLVSLVSASAAG